MIKSSLEVVYIFLEVFPVEKSEAALGQVAKNAPTPPKPKHQARGKSAVSGGHKPTGGKSSPLPQASWPEIRKLLAVDLRPRLLGITSELVSTSGNAPLVEALKHGPMPKLTAANITRASKPAGLLWVWCNALVLCDDSIKHNRVVAAQLQQEEVS